MNNGIPIDDSAAMAGNLVKAVEDIAVAVGSASDVFGRSFGEFASQFKTSMSGVTDSVKTLQNEMVDVIKSLDVNIKVIKNIRIPTVAAPKPPKQTAIKESSDPTQSISDGIKNAFENVAKGFGDVFAVTKEQVAGMKKSGKKGGKQNPFEMDMGALSTEKKAGPGIDISEKFVKDINASSEAWNNVFSNVSKTAKQWKEIGDQQNILMNAFQNVGQGFGEVFAATKEQMSGMLKSGKKGGRQSPFEMDMGALAVGNKVAGPGIDIPSSFLTGMTDSAAAWNDVFSNRARLSQETANQSQIASLIEDVRSMLGDATDQAQALGLEMQAAFDPRTYVEQAQDAIDGLGESVSQQTVEVTSVLENLFYDIAEEASNASQAAAASRAIPTTGQMYQGGYSTIGINENYVSPNAAAASRTIPTTGQMYQGGYSTLGIAQNYVPQNIAPQAYQGGQGVPLAAQPAPPPPGGNRVVQVGPNGASNVAQANNTAQILQSTAAFASLHNASINVGNSFNQFPSLFNQITSGMGAKGGLGGLGGQAFQTLGGMFGGGGGGGGGGGAAAAGGAGRRLGTAAAANPLSAAIVAPFAAAIAGGAAIMASFNAIVSTSNSIMSMFGGMISKVAPALTMQFQIVANDLEAVVGRGLIPMFMRLTEAQRTMADAMVPVATATTDLYEGFGKMYKIIVEAVMPLYQAVVGLLAPAFSYIVSLLNDFLDGLKPIINVFSGLINVVTYVLTGFFNFIKIFDIISIIFKAFSDGMKYIFGGLIIGFGKLLEWMSYIPGLGGLKKASENVKRFGMDTFAGNAAGVQKGASVGAAVREVGSTSIEGIGDEIRKASLMIQVPEGEKQKEQIDYLKDIAENTFNFLKKPGEKVDIHTVERPPEPAPSKPYLGKNYMMPGGVY